MSMYEWPYNLHVTEILTFKYRVEYIIHAMQLFVFTVDILLACISIKTLFQIIKELVQRAKACCS